MLSKQQKQRYGEVLRQQMKQKEERKKIQDMQKRGNIRQLQPPREQPPMTYKPTAIQKQNSYQRPYVDPKQQLQKKLESQDYNYFGGNGGGAPNRRIPDQNSTNNRNMSQPTNLRLGGNFFDYSAEQMMQYSGNSNRPYQNEYPNQAQQRVRTFSEEAPYYANQGMPNPLQSISPQSVNYPRQQEAMYYQEGGNSSVPQGRMPNPYQQQGTQNYQGGYNNGYGTNRQDGRQQISYEYIPENTKQINSRIQQYQPNNSPYMQQQSYQQKPNMYQPPQMTQPPMQTQMPYQMMEDQSNEEAQEVFKKGGRNLLKLENQTIDQHLVKQKRKLEIQKQLKQQIQEAERRKKEEKQRLKRQEEEDEKKHIAYLAQQKRKVDEEERKNRQAKQKIIDDNLRNIEQKKQMEEEAKRKVERQRLQKQRRQNQNIKAKEQQNRQQEEAERQKRNPPQQVIIQEPRGAPRHAGRVMQDDNSSVVSSQTSDLEKGFNTALSKEFFRKQRERNNPSISNNNQHFEKVTSQIQKMNYELSQQRREIQKIIDEKQRAEIDKRKADEEIQRLKRELKRKMDEDNQKLLRALQGDYNNNNDFNRLPQQHYRNLNEYQAPYEQNDNEYPTFAKKPMRQREQESLVQKEYQPQPVKYIPKEQETNQFEQSNVGLMSLDGDSKKIPLFLEHSDKLTMSQVQNFAKDSAYFQKGGVNGLNRNSPAKPKYNTRINESIAEEAEEDRDYANNNSRRSNRSSKNPKKESSLYKEQKDELDRLIDSRAKSRGGWGQMSSVNSDITKEIDELLKRKENGLGNSNGRPSSISNAGKQSLSKQGYAYDGLTLNSNVGGTLGTNGTMDLERINGRNDARLRQLKNLGVQTINTNGDDDLNALDQLLNKYK